jgi:hypothetical protein
MSRVIPLRVLAFPIVLIVLANLSGCASLQGTKSEERLRERVIQYWDARKNGDSTTQYRLDWISVTKDLSLNEYIGRQKAAEILAYTIKSIKIDDEKNEAMVRLDAKVRMKLAGFSTKPLQKELVDWWIFAENNWYHEERPFFSKEKMKSYRQNE